MCVSFLKMPGFVQTETPKEADDGNQFLQAVLF